ncbi:MAG: hypothetical protein HY701_12700 [Gemmatimonadetes bacterium]|nr:hypothetical protein [Gemmatimonadota bacterium]
MIGEALHTRTGWVKTAPASALTLVKGTVAVARDPFNYSGDVMLDAFDDVLSSELEEADRRLAAWPDGYASLAGFLDEFWPKRMPEGFGRGSCSGHQMVPSWTEAFRRTAVYVTVTDPQGCAEGVYHEVGHLRLEALGMNIDDHDGTLITNPIEELYVSPVRKDCKRPMCAVIQALYSWLILTEGDLWCASRISREEARPYLTQNLPKIEEGIGEVERHVRTTPDGAVFIASMMDWARDIVTRGTALLTETNDAARTVSI